MTIKEAIDYLRQIADNAEVANYSEALRVALDALSEVERLREEIKAEKWIPVEEAMPPDLTDILVHYESGDIEVDCRFTKRGFIGEETYGKVTHWKPLPKPPVIDQA